MNKKYQYLILSMLLPFLCLNKVYAECPQSEIEEFKKYEDQYKITYELNKSTNKYTIKLFFALTDKYSYSYEENMVNCSAKEEWAECPNILPGEYVFIIDSSNNTCSVKEITLTLPKYNIYSEDPLCEGIEEFVLCKDTYDNDIDYETFKSRVNLYKKNKSSYSSSHATIKEEKKGNVIFNKLLQYVKENLTNIIIITVFTILVITTIIISIKSINKSRRLE